MPDLAVRKFLGLEQKYEKMGNMKANVDAVMIGCESYRSCRREGIERKHVMTVVESCA